MFRDMGFATPVICVVYLGERTTAVNSDRNSNAVRTHGIVLRNAGKRTAYNVRIGHVVATASYQMYPSVSHKVEQGPNGSSEIVIPTLVPNEQITLSYLYFAPLYWNQVNSYTKSD